MAPNGNIIHYDAPVTPTELNKTRELERNRKRAERQAFIGGKKPVEKKQNSGCSDLFVNFSFTPCNGM